MLLSLMNLGGVGSYILPGNFPSASGPNLTRRITVRKHPDAKKRGPESSPGSPELPPPRSPARTMPARGLLTHPRPPRGAFTNPGHTPIMPVTIVENCFAWTPVQRLLDQLKLLPRHRLLRNKRCPLILVATKDRRSRRPAQIAIQTLLVHIELAGHIVRQPFTK